MASTDSLGRSNCQNAHVNNAETARYAASYGRTGPTGVGSNDVANTHATRNANVGTFARTSSIALLGINPAPGHLVIAQDVRVVYVADGRTPIPLSSQGAGARFAHRSIRSGDSPCG